MLFFFAKLILAPSVGAERFLEELLALHHEGGLTPIDRIQRVMQLWVDIQEDVLHPPTARTMLRALLELSTRNHRKIGFMLVSTNIPTPCAIEKGRAATMTRSKRKEAAQSTSTCMTMPLIARILQIASVVFVQMQDLLEASSHKNRGLRVGRSRPVGAGCLVSDMCDDAEEALSDDEDESTSIEESGDCRSDDNDHNDSDHDASPCSGQGPNYSPFVPASEINVTHLTLSDMLADTSDCSDDDGSDFSEDDGDDPIIAAKMVADSILAFRNAIRDALGAQPFEALVQMASSLSDTKHQKAIRTLSMQQ